MLSADSCPCRLWKRWPARDNACHAFIYNASSAEWRNLHFAPELFKNTRDAGWAVQGYKARLTWQTGFHRENFRRITYVRHAMIPSRAIDLGFMRSSAVGAFPMSTTTMPASPW